MSSTVTTIFIPVDPALIGGGAVTSAVVMTYVLWLAQFTSGTTTTITVTPIALTVNPTAATSPQVAAAIALALKQLAAATSGATVVTSNPKTNGVGSNSDSIVFSLFTGGAASWGAPLWVAGVTLIGGELAGVNVLAAIGAGGDYEDGWWIISNPPIRIQEMCYIFNSGCFRVVGRDAALTNYVYSDDLGFTWTEGNPAGTNAWQGTGSNGLYN